MVSYYTQLYICVFLILYYYNQACIKKFTAHDIATEEIYPAKNSRLLPNHSMKKKKNVYIIMDDFLTNPMKVAKFRTAVNRRLCDF